jgi:hypothetical protein
MNIEKKLNVFEKERAYWELLSSREIINMMGYLMILFDRLGVDRLNSYDNIDLWEFFSKI